jgi:sulfate adenylyltransferase subunit 1 (EFTu-like GTPase family)
MLSITFVLGVSIIAIAVNNIDTRDYSKGSGLSKSEEFRIDCEYLKNGRVVKNKCISRAKGEDIV